MSSLYTGHFLQEEGGARKSYEYIHIIIES